MAGEMVEPHQLTQRPMGSISILLVDDDAICLNIVAATLKSWKYEVVTVKHPIEALCTLRVRGGSFDLVITDVHMPDMNGFELQKRIDEEFNLPVVFMSADDQESVILRGLQGGGAFFLVKPITPNDLKNLWQYAVAKKKAKSAVIEELESTQESSKADKQAINELNHSPSENEQGSNDAAVGSETPLRNEDWNSTNDSKRKSPENVEDGEDDDDDDSGKPKKNKIVWTNALHHKFLEAVKSVGIDRAVPKKILQLMNEPGLKRENVASHLQKYRIFLKRVAEAAEANIKVQSPSERTMVERTFRSKYAMAQPQLLHKKPHFRHLQNLNQGGELAKSLQPDLPITNKKFASSAPNSTPLLGIGQSRPLLNQTNSKQPLIGNAKPLYQQANPSAFRTESYHQPTGSLLSGNGNISGGILNGTTSFMQPYQQKYQATPKSCTNNLVPYEHPTGSLLNGNISGGIMNGKTFMQPYWQRKDQVTPECRTNDFVPHKHPTGSLLNGNRNISGGIMNGKTFMQPYWQQKDQVTPECRTNDFVPHKHPTGSLLNGNRNISGGIMNGKTFMQPYWQQKDQVTPECRTNDFVPHKHPTGSLLNGNRNISGGIMNGKTFMQPYWQQKDQVTPECRTNDFVPYEHPTGSLLNGNRSISGGIMNGKTFMQPYQQKDQVTPECRTNDFVRYKHPTGSLQNGNVNISGGIMNGTSTTFMEPYQQKDQVTPGSCTNDPITGYGNTEDFANSNLNPRPNCPNNSSYVGIRLTSDGRLGGMEADLNLNCGSTNGLQSESTSKVLELSGDSGDYRGQGEPFVWFQNGSYVPPTFDNAIRDDDDTLVMPRSPVNLEKMSDEQPVSSGNSGDCSGQEVPSIGFPSGSDVLPTFDNAIEDEGTSLMQLSPTILQANTFGNEGESDNIFGLPVQDENTSAMPLSPTIFQANPFGNEGESDHIFGISIQDENTSVMPLSPAILQANTFGNGGESDHIFGLLDNQLSNNVFGVDDSNLNFLQPYGEGSFNISNDMNIIQPNGQGCFNNPNDMNIIQPYGEGGFNIPDDINILQPYGEDSFNIMDMDDINILQSYGKGGFNIPDDINILQPYGEDSFNIMDMDDINILQSYGEGGFNIPDDINIIQPYGDGSFNTQQHDVGALNSAFSIGPDDHVQNNPIVLNNDQTLEQPSGGEMIFSNFGMDGVDEHFPVFDQTFDQFPSQLVDEEFLESVNSVLFDDDEDAWMINPRGS